MPTSHPGAGSLRVNGSTVEVYDGKKWVSVGSTVFGTATIRDLEWGDPYKSDPLQLADGSVAMVHKIDACKGEFCAIHRPCDHPLRDAPFAWREGRLGLGRMCEHNVVHPDPDDLAYKWETMDKKEFQRKGYDRHTCKCGCCI